MNWLMNELINEWIELNWIEMNWMNLSLFAMDNKQVKSSQVAFNERVWQSHKLTIKIQLISVQTQKHIAQKLIAQNTWEKNN